jgi:cellulose synthase/poly-beta-1,6-N-acetylglucosamine synthase-like glycosyltransferase
LEAYPFEMASLAEDREYGLYLVTRGLRIRYLARAVSKGQAASHWRDATVQRRRWHGGVFHLQRRYTGALLRAAWTRHSLDALDSALELALPSFSALCLLSAGLALLQGILWLAGEIAWTSFAVSAVLTASAAAYPLLGLLAERAPRSSYGALLYGPYYAAWRVWIAITVWLRRGRVPWIRTRRDKELLVQ